MNIFKSHIPEDRWHPIYKLITEDVYAPERDVLLSWANGFFDRDGKFIKEFQSTFEPCLWELYLFACLKELGAEIDLTNNSPDFCAFLDQKFSIEATICAPAQGEQPPYGTKEFEPPEDFTEFNSQSTLRICNSFSSKERKFQESYKDLDHVKDNPFVLAIASYDRPFSHMAANRPIFSALYGIYYDEKYTIENRLANVVNYNVTGVIKNEKTEIPLGLFQDDSYKHISAVIYSSLVTWGKVRALADNPDAVSMYMTFHPNEKSIHPVVKQTLKRDYREHLMDGLYILHNPYAEKPLKYEIFNHPRVAQVVPKDNYLDIIAPDDFLLIRQLMSFVEERD